MTAARRIVVTVAADGTVSAETVGITGSKCLHYIAVLEDLLVAPTVRSSYTADYAATDTVVVVRQEQNDGV